MIELKSEKEIELLHNKLRYRLINVSCIPGTNDIFKELSQLVLLANKGIKASEAAT